MVRVQPLYRSIEIEEQRALPIIADHALDPEERRRPCTSTHWRDVMKARRGVQNQVTGGQLYRMRAVCVLHDEFSSVIFIRMREE